MIFLYVRFYNSNGCEFEYKLFLYEETRWRIYYNDQATDLMSKVSFFLFM